MGLALGGAVGGALAAYIAQDRFKPLLEVILVDMKQDQRDRMVQGLRNVLANVGTAPHLVASQAEVTIPNNAMFCFRGCGRPGAGGRRAGQPGAEGEAGAGDGHLPQQTVQHLCQRVKMGMMTDSTFNNTTLQQYNIQ